MEENDPALACTQAEEKPTIALKLADAQRELANAKLNATMAANEANKQRTDQKKKNKDLMQMIRKLKRKVADGAVAAGKLERAHTRATAQQQKKVESLTGLNMQLGNKLAMIKRALKDAENKTKELQGNLATVRKMRTKAATNASINEEKQATKTSKARSRFENIDWTSQNPFAVRPAMPLPGGMMNLWSMQQPLAMPLPGGMTNPWQLMQQMQHLCRR